jgi:ATP-dependent 26S proteasome regulatory subunit
MDEIDAIGGRRFSEGTSADREIQRTLMELLNQLDGFDQLGKVISLSVIVLNVYEICTSYKYIYNNG